MRAKEKVQDLCRKIDLKFSKQFGFKIKDVTFTKVMDYMYAPKDSSSLAVTRILFGIAMLFDIPDERGGATMVRRWGDPRTCHFPLLSILQPIGLPYMAIVYAALWLGALGIALGYKYRIAAPVFTACYWYLFLIDKSFWNNHSYLFGLVALLLTCSEADCYWSIDAYLDPSKKKSTVPYWNYFVLKYQFFILYFMAGMKKGTAEWLTGYSVQNLSEHWVFEPFKLFLTVPQTDYLVVHWFVFMFDLTVAIWMMWSRTRHVAMVFCAMFHLMNSRIFRIGMFPWVCLATMPLFYPFDWPKRVASEVTHMKFRHCIWNKVDQFIKKYICGCKKEDFKDKVNQVDVITKVIDEEYKSKDKKMCKGSVGTTTVNETTNKTTNDVTNETSKFDHEFDSDKLIASISDDRSVVGYTGACNVKDDDYKIKKVTIYMIMFYVFLQVFLPYSHFLTKGYNNWTEGLYGYSWDMMVHTWDTRSVVVKIVDNDKNEEMFIDPQLYTLNDRWSRHGDMLYQYAQCLKNNLDRIREMKWINPSKVLSANISIYVDIWCSLNGRFVQRMFDPKVDLLKASWSPFCEVPYLMPLIDDAEHWRKNLDDIRNEVHSWNEKSDVVFYADFPGYEQEIYISEELKNITLTILDGLVVYEPEVTKYRIGQSFKMTRGKSVHVNPGTFHKVLNIGENPAFYMYTFYNNTEVNGDKDINLSTIKLPIFRELSKRLVYMVGFGNLVISNILKLFKFSHCS